MKRVVRLAANDLRLTARDRPALFWLLVLPVLLMWLFGRMGSDDGEAEHIALAVVDADGGWLSRALVDELGSERIALDSRTGPLQEGAGEDGPVPALVIPDDFTTGLAAGEPRTLRLETAPDTNDARDVAAWIHVVRASVRLVSRLIQLEREPAWAGLGDAERLARLRGLAARPRLVSLAVRGTGRGSAVPGGFEQSVPGILAFTVLMMTLIYGAVFLTIEKREGMLRRQALSPASRGEIIAGKLLGRVLIAAAQIVILVLVGWLAFDVSWGRSPVGLTLMLASYAAAVGGLATLLGAVLANPAQASIVGWIGAMVLAALGGCWWPSEVMPAWMRTLGHAFPTAWAMDGFHALISFGAGVEAVLLPSAVLVGFAAAFAAAGARLLRV